MNRLNFNPDDLDSINTVHERAAARALILYQINAQGNTKEERTKALQEESQMVRGGSREPLNDFSYIHELFSDPPLAKAYHILVVLPQGEHSRPLTLSSLNSPNPTDMSTSFTSTPCIVPRNNSLPDYHFLINVNVSLPLLNIQYAFTNAPLQLNHQEE